MKRRASYFFLICCSLILCATSYAANNDIAGTWVLKAPCSSSLEYNWYVYSPGNFKDNLGTGGTWILNGDRITLSYNDAVHTIYTGTINAEGTYMEGTRSADSGHDTRMWCATRQTSLCAASVSPSLAMHLPITTYNGSNYWVDLQYNSADATLVLTNAGIVNDARPYSNCAASSLSSDFLLHVPDVWLDGGSYWAYLQYNGSGFVFTVFGQNPPILTGSVVKGPVSSATVNFFALNSDGTKGALIGNANTDSNGNFTVYLTATPQGPILAEASGGSYVNEISGFTETLLSTDRLTAVLPAGTTVAAVTPLTHMAATRTRVLAAAGMPVATAVNAANIGVAQQYQLLDIIGTLPVAINNAAQIATASLEQRRYGLVLAGITKVAADLNVRPIDLAQAFATDMEDGILDGLGDNPIPIPTISGPVIYMPPGTAIQSVQGAINLLISSGNSVINMSGMTISLVPVNINPLVVPFFITSTALPAWIEGQNSTATITASAPCTWTIPPGTVLPEWLRLNAPAGPGLNAALVGTPPLLPAGSTSSLSPPFVVQCQNAAGAVYAIQWTATVVKAPPVTIPIPATCVAGTKGVVLPVARAEGGVPPYYFKSPSFMYGAPPLGMSVWLDGTLRGTCPSAPGTYTFPVAAVDSIGADPLAQVTLTVSATPPPTQKPNLSPYQPTGWSDKIVVSKTAICTYNSCIDSSPLLSSDTLYVNWAEDNEGTTATSATFYIQLYVDEVLIQSWRTDPPLYADQWNYIAAQSIGSLSAGTHTIKIVVDSDNTVDESNESDNTYTKTITVSSAAPQTATLTGSWLGTYTYPAGSFLHPDIFQTASLIWTLTQTGTDVTGTFERTITAISGADSYYCGTSSNPNCKPVGTKLSGILGGDVAEAGTILNIIEFSADWNTSYNDYWLTITPTNLSYSNYGGLEYVSLTKQ